MSGMSADQRVGRGAEKEFIHRRVVSTALGSDGPRSLDRESPSICGFFFIRPAPSVENFLAVTPVLIDVAGRMDGQVFRFVGDRKLESDAIGSRTMHWVALGVLLAFFLVFNLGGRGLNEPDEARYTNISRAMLAGSGDWWVPRMSGFAHFDKPPLVYWVTAASLKLWGDSETAARVPSLLGSVLALTGIGWTAWRLYGAVTAWWTVLFCGTLGQFFVLSRMLTPDMLLTGFTTLGVGFWAEARHRPGRGGWWWWGCALAFALAWWTKATAALVPLLGLAVGLKLTGDDAGWKALRPGRLLLFIAVAGSPWYLDLMLREPELRDFFLGRELAGRVVGHPDGRKGPFYYHLAFSLVGWLPWWPAALVLAFRERGRLLREIQLRRARAVPLEGWVVLTGLTVFSLLSSKLVTYTLPYAPWAALWCVRILGGLSEPRWTPSRLRFVVRCAAVFLLFYIAAGFVLPRIETRLGLGSSVRSVGVFLRDHHAGEVYVDRYFPSLEQYFGERVYYVKDQPPRQLTTDAGVCPGLGQSHFVTPNEAERRLMEQPGTDRWLIRYKGKSSSPLTRTLTQLPVVEEIRLGDFVLDHVAASPGVSSARREHR